MVLYYTTDIGFYLQLKLTLLDHRTLISCMAPNLLLKKCLWGCVRVCTCGRHQKATFHPIFSRFLHLPVQRAAVEQSSESVTWPSWQQCESPGSPAGNRAGAVHSAPPTQGPWCCVSPEGRSEKENEVVNIHRSWRCQYLNQSQSHIPKVHGMSVHWLCTWIDTPHPSLPEPRRTHWDPAVLEGISLAEQRQLLTRAHSHFCSVVWDPCTPPALS